GGRGARLREPDLVRARAAANADWSVALGRARPWRVERQLEALREACRTGVLPRPRRLWRPVGTISVAFSGLDGSGKSTQARALRDALEALGSDAAVEWAPARLPSLRFIANPVRRVLRLGARSDAPPGLSHPDLRPAHAPTVVAHGWVAIQAFAIALSLWRSQVRHALRGHVVILDRQTLDFAVFELYRHGAGRRLAQEIRLLRALAPPP